MKPKDLLSRTNPLRASARRAWIAASDRADVRGAQLLRRVEVLEELQQVTERVKAIAPAFIQALSPMAHADLRLARIGSEFDGGYVLPRTLVEGASGVVSIGVGDNNEADVALAEAGLRVHAWDHTVPGLPREHAFITFHRLGLGSSAISPELQPLDEIARASFGSEQDLVLLMDAEGAEWQELAYVSMDTLRRFSVASFELHGLGDVLLPGSCVLRTLQRIREQFVPVAVHANNHGTFWPCDDFILPDALEVTYVRADLMPEGAMPGNCARELLSPCCPDVDEIELPWAGGAVR